MKKAQISLFVLLGIIILLLVGVALYVYSSFNSVNVDINNHIAKKFADDPELQADYKANYERLVTCVSNLEKNSVENFASLSSGEPIIDYSIAEKLLSDEVKQDFNTCFEKFNTKERMNYSLDQNPSVDTTINQKTGEITVMIDNIVINAKTRDGKSYTIEEPIIAKKQTKITNIINTRKKIIDDFNKLRSGNSVDNPVITPEGFFNKYSLEAECKIVDFENSGTGEGRVFIRDYCDLDQYGLPALDYFDISNIPALQDSPEVKILDTLNNEEGKIICQNQGECQVLDTTFNKPTVVSELDVVDGKIDAGYYEPGDYDLVADEVISGEHYVQFSIINIAG